MKPLATLQATLLIASLLGSALAQERTHTAEEMEKISKGEALPDEEAERPADLPDLTKNEPIPPPKKGAPQVWVLGPTGIMCLMNSGNANFTGDQLFVKGAIKGSPADGKVLPGDVITSIGGVKLKAGGHLGVTIGNAIMESERSVNGGSFKFGIWRDLNYVQRNAAKEVTTVDIDKLFNEIQEDNSLYEWKPEEERTQEVKQVGFDKFPIKPTTLDVEIKLRVFPEYSDTAPLNCPKTMAILEDAWKVLEKKFKPDPANPRGGRGDTLAAVALAASGKPEHRKLLRDWVRGKSSPWAPPTEPIGAMFQPGYRGVVSKPSWSMGATGLNCALYYEATGDDHVLPALRKYAIETAMGQSGGGTWGHGFAMPSFNGGKLNQMNPGYGALNAAGNRCFMLIALAQKLGIKDPAIDQAVKRSQDFFSSYIDQGCIPYGDHAAYGSDDSNGKNSGVAFALKLLGDDYGARYFAQMSGHCAFTRRGGHGHDYTGEWSSWAATLCGPELRALNERNLRWRRTLCRMYDGSFIYQSPTGTYRQKDDPTSVEVLHQSLIFKQSLITGKDLDESWHLSPREMKQMLASAQAQFNDPYLDQLAGKPWKERSTEEIFDLLDIFYPKARGNFAKELGARFQAGEKAIAERLLGLLTHESARYRDGALKGLAACGNDTVLANLSRIIPLLDDPKDFVRITAARVVSVASDRPEAQLAVVEAGLKPSTAAPNHIGNTLYQTLFNPKGQLAAQPYQSGIDPAKMDQLLERLILLDPATGSFMGGIVKIWDKETVLRLAGPLVYAAEEEQINDQMFANRAAAPRALLARFGYREGFETTAHLVRKQGEVPRYMRPYVGFKRPLLYPQLVEKAPEEFIGLLPAIENTLISNPNTQITIKDDSTGWQPVTTPLRSAHSQILAARSKPPKAPSIAAESIARFNQQVQQLEGTGAKIKLCSDALADPSRKNTFEKIAAMDQLADLLGADAFQLLLPYLNHDYWRLREHSLDTAAKLIRSGGAKALAALYQPKDRASESVGVLAAFARSGDATGSKLATSALAEESPELRRQAAITLASIDKDKAIAPIIGQLGKASDPLERDGCELALNQLAATSPTKVRDAVIASLGGLKAGNLASAWYVLSSIGDDASLDVLAKAGKTESKSEFSALASALSYSPSRRADKILLEFAATNKESAALVAPHSVRRMVMGPKGFGDITDAQRMDFAEPMIKMHLDPKLIEFLGQVHHARALRTLLYCLQNGVSDAAETMILNAETTKSFSPEDAKVAAEALRNVIEFIEVTQLRGGAEGKDFREYPIWKELQARAGKVLLRVHKPEKQPIQALPGLDLE